MCSNDLATKYINYLQGKMAKNYNIHTFNKRRFGTNSNEKLRMGNIVRRTRWKTVFYEKWAFAGKNIYCMHTAETAYDQD